jgi:ABC-type transport system involved in multi-copper enzyme maturation permease subunit
MTGFRFGLQSALWAEFLKARRSKVTLLTGLGFLILPVVSGVFMIILKDPEAARSMGLISTKAQLAAGVADWPTHLGMLNMGVSIGGLIVYAMITAWLFGREFVDHTVKELLAVPTPRWAIVAAKFLLLAVWLPAISLLIFVVGLGIGALVNIPGWSAAGAWSAFGAMMVITALVYMLMAPVAYFASAGRGYLPPLGWAFLTLVLAQIAGALGWGELFPWAVPALLSEVNGPRLEPMGFASYAVVALVFAIGVVATLRWWQRADQAGG